MWCSTLTRPLFLSHSLINPRSGWLGLSDVRGEERERMREKDRGRRMSEGELKVK